MSTLLDERPILRSRPGGTLAWGLVLAGFAALFVPTYVDLARGLWRDDAYSHGPIVLAVFFWLVWRARGDLAALAGHGAPAAGTAVLGAGLLLYLLGRTQSLPLFEVAAQVPVIAGAALLVGGGAALARLAFPLCFLAFAVPLPGFILDFVTVPLKEIVSQAVAAVLGVLGYPVVREGVVLLLGDHEMLVADACSGLNSIYSLFALGLLYANLTPPRRAARTAALLAAIVPVAVAANIVRVLILVLATYHLGASATQGWIHDAAGLSVFIVAFALLLAFDRLVRYAGRNRWREAPRASEVAFDQPVGHVRDASRLRRAAGLAVAAMIAMVGTAAAAPALKPVADGRPAPDLEAVFPAAFGEWRLDPEIVPVAPAPDVQTNLDRIYRQVLSRTYVNPEGERMMLLVAHGGDQSDALKAHRQESCYAAQGFDIRWLAHGQAQAMGRSLPVTRMLAVRGERSEPVTYWFTMGDRVVLGRAERLRVQVENGLAGRVPDGMLVRVSSLSHDARSAFAAQQRFIEAVAAALPREHAARFIGRGA